MRSERRSLLQVGQDKERDRFDKITACPNLKFLDARSITALWFSGQESFDRVGLQAFAVQGIPKTSMDGSIGILHDNAKDG